MADELAKLLAEHDDWLVVERGLAVNSLAAYRRDLRRYATFLRAHDAADPSRIGEDLVHAYVRHLGKARKHVIEKGGGEGLSVLVVGNLFVKRGAETLRNAADDLRLDKKRVHHRSAVMADDIIEDLNDTGAGIDRDRAGMRCV